MLSVVLRQFRSDRDHAVGDVLDTSGFRLETQLREQRYLRAADADEIAEFRALKKSSKQKPDEPASEAGEPEEVAEQKPAATESEPRPAAPLGARKRKAAKKRRT